ncbi:MAG: DMT family transporter [Rhodoglobus sp.]
MMEPTPAPAPRPHSRAAVATAVAAAMVCGVGIASQARVNGELSHELGDGVLAALISFSTGLVIVAIAVVIAPSGRRGLAAVRTAIAERSIPWWYAAGGAAGAFLVLSQGLTAAVLGVALFTVAVVAGQTLSGLVLDARGLGAMAAKPVTATRIIGSVLALAAVAYAASAQLHGNVPIWMMLLPFLAGFGIGWQQAVNGQMREVSGSAITATFINFTVGTTVLLIAKLVHSTWAGWPTMLPTNPVLYLGGVVGVIFIAGAAVIVRITGVLLLGLGTIAGQLVGSLLLDIFAPVAGHDLTVPTVVGTALTLVAVSIAAIPRRRRA